MTNILLTGASGFLGTYLLKDLLKTGAKVYAFSRHPRSSDTANLKWLQADISVEESLLRAEILDELADIDIIIHAAALYDLTADREAHYRHNVIGTSNLLHLVRLLKTKPHFAHISSIAIAGNAEGNFDETKFDVGQGFPDAYSSTKFASENMVRSASDIQSRSIYRLGIVVGSSVDGSIPKIDGAYYLQRMIHMIKPFKEQIGKLKFVPMPYNESTRLYLIPVDIASQLIAELVGKVANRNGVATFHVLGGGRGVSVRRAIQTMFAHYDIPGNPFPVPKFVLRPSLFKIFRAPATGVEYLHTKWTFSSKNLEKELPDFRYPSYAHFSAKIMDYADTHFFSKEKKK